MKQQQPPRGHQGKPRIAQRPVRTQDQLSKDHQVSTINIQRPYIYMYYYTPLTLNPANNNQQPRLHAVLAIAASQRFGPFAHVAILVPRWSPYKIQVLSQKVTNDGPGPGAKSGGALHTVRTFGPQTAIFPPNPGETPKQSGTVATSHVRLDFAMLESPLLPFTCKICPKDGPERSQKAPNLRNVHKHPKTKHRPYLGLCGSKRIPRAPSPPATPHFLWFPPLGIAQTDA